MKKRFFVSSIIFILVLSMASSVLAYAFPQPDWGKLFEERKAMVSAVDFELYAEDSYDSAPYFYEKFEPRGGTYLGTVVDNSAKFKPLGSYITNIDEMNNTDLYYPANTIIPKDNVVTLIGWTIYDLSKVNYNTVRKTLNNLNKYNKPMLIRFANEMNCSSLGDNPKKYVEIFRNVAKMIKEYPNFGVVWSPNDIGALDRPFEYYYPGDEYVDWVGVSCYTMKYFQGKKNTSTKDSIFFMTGDNAWATNKLKPFMEFLKKNKIRKPVMLSECGVATSNKFGENLTEWTKPRMRNLLWNVIMKYPQIKMINYFDYYRKGANESYNISAYPYACEIFNEAKRSGAYIREYGKNANFVFQSVGNAGNIDADSNGIVNFYTLAHIPGYPVLTVNYFIDGKWYTMSSKAPYKCKIDLNKLADGKHTVTISTIGNKKDYVFYKKGNCIRLNSEPR